MGAPPKSIKTPRLVPPLVLVTVVGVPPVTVASLHYGVARGMYGQQQLLETISI